MTTSCPAFWKRYSLQALFVLMTLCCIVLGLWSVYVSPYRRQAQSIAALERLSTEVTTYPAEGTAFERWLVTTLVGQDAFLRVREVDLRGPAIDDAVVQNLAGLIGLKSLFLEQTHVTDAGLATIRSMSQLESLTLTYSLATGRGVARLKELPHLKYLRLTGTPLTDAVIPNLAAIPSLQALYLRWTGVSDAGAAKFRELAPGCAIFHAVLSDDN